MADTHEDIQEHSEIEQAKAPAQAKTAPHKSWRRALIVTGVVLASLIMALSILLPSLSAVIEGLTSSDDASTTAASTEAATTEDAATTEASTEDAMQEYIDTVDERYSATVDTLKAKVEADATDKASIINLANTYYTWGTSVTNYATSDAQQEHVQELLQNAITYYDQYLALEDSNAVHVNRALCQYYLGDINSSIHALEDFCETVADYAPAWANLGMMYTSAGENDLALSAYNKALTVDPNDEYGLKSSIESQIETLSATTKDAETAE